METAQTCGPRSHGFIDLKLAYLQQPITPEALLVKVRQVLAT